MSESWRMRCLLFCLTTLFGASLSPAAVQAQTGAGVQGSVINQSPISILDYGARCDGFTDDSAAINAAADAWRSEGAGHRAAHLVFPSRGACLIKSPINLTNVGSRGALLDGNGAVILCETGSLCIDATGDTGVDIANLVLRGSPRNMPRIGIQWARESTKVGCSLDNTRNLVITGDFSFAPVYIESCEDMSWTNAYIENDYTAGSAWLVVEDGLNHWDAASPFQDISVGHRPYGYGMDELVWTNPLFFQKGPGHMMWLANSHTTELIGEAYGNSNGGAAPFVLYDEPRTWDNGNLTVEMHFEENHQESVFELDGPNPSPVINGLTWRERGSQPVKYIFTRGPGVRTATLDDVKIQIQQWFGGRRPVPKMFDDPSAWSVNGDVFLPSLDWWDQPAHWSGCISTMTSARECSLGSVTMLASTAATENLAFAASGDNTYDITVSQPLTLTLSGGAAGQAQRLTLVLRQGAASPNPVTLPVNVTWIGNHRPKMADTLDRDAVVTFLTDDGGKTYFGWMN